MGPKIHFIPGIGGGLNPKAMGKSMLTLCCPYGNYLSIHHIKWDAAHSLDGLSYQGIIAQHRYSGLH